MIYEESDIDFSKLSDTAFEELCFDLLVKVGAYDLIWRQGGADSGRDIEASFTVTNPLVGPFQERWFVECKNHSSGLGPTEIESKISWAKAERPAHFLLITSTYLTNNTRTWLEKICQDAPFKTHLIEGKRLKTILLNYSSLMNRYFARPIEPLLRQSIAELMKSGAFPNASVLQKLILGLDISKLTIHEMAFLLVSFIFKEDEIERWELDNEPYSCEHLIQYLMALAEPSVDPRDSCIITERHFEGDAPGYKRAGWVSILKNVTGENETRFFCVLLEIEDDQVLEIWLECDDDRFHSSVRRINSTIRSEQKRHWDWGSSLLRDQNKL